jgi:hypothetical protein
MRLGKATTTATTMMPIGQQIPGMTTPNGYMTKATIGYNMKGVEADETYWGKGVGEGKGKGNGKGNSFGNSGKQGFACANCGTKLHTTDERPVPNKHTTSAVEKNIHLQLQHKTATMAKENAKVEVGIDMVKLNGKESVKVKVAKAKVFVVNQSASMLIASTLQMKTMTTTITGTDSLEPFQRRQGYLLREFPGWEIFRRLQKIWRKQKR